MKKAVMRDYYKCMCCLIALFIMSYPLYSQFSKNNLLFWVRSDTLLTTTGSSLNIWNDISGNNFNFIAISSPTVNTSNPSGFTSIFFDNSSLLSNNVTSIANFEAFIVYKKSGGVNVYERLIDHNYLDGFWIGRNNNSSHNFGGGYKNAVAPLGIFDDFPDTIANIMHVCKKNNIHSVSNGISSTITQTLSNFSPTLSNKITIGCDLSQTGNLKGDIFEIIFFNDSIRNSVKDSIFTYLKNKYASPINLPADISLTNTLCDTIIKAKGNFNSYHWSTGATTPTISVNKSGKYWVKATNIFGKISSDTINVTFPGNLPQILNLCGNQPKEWNTQLPKNQFTFLWQDNSTDSLLTISSPGIYSVTISDGFGCSASHSINVTQDNFSSTTSLGLDLALCAGNQIALTTGIQPGLTYTWSTGQNAAAITVTNTGQYSVIATNTNNCVAKDTINVYIIGAAPNVDFSNSLACKNNAVVFTDNSSPPSGNSLSNWFWNFGDGNTLADTSLLQNPFYTYSDTGNYTINLSVQTNVGCKQNYTKTIHVAPTPSVNFNNLIACQNDTASFTNLSSSPNYNPLTYSWNFGDPASGSNNLSSSQNPKHLFSQQGNFPVKLITTNNAGCKDSTTKTINVKSQVKANFTNSAACKNAPTIFTDNSIVPAPNNQNIRLWTIGTNTYSGTSVTRTFTNTGVYPVTLSVSGLNGCNSSISKYLNVFLPPSSNFTVPTICANDTITVTNLSLPQSGVLLSNNWKLNGAAYSSVSSPSLLISSAGNYNLQLSTSNSFGCTDSITKIISVLPLPNVDFTTNPSNYYFTNSPITFSPTISNGSFYQWNFNGALYTAPSFSTSINSAGTYTNSLFMTDAFGCSNTKTKALTVSDYLLDLAIIDVKTQKDNNNFISVEVNLANFGTAPINSFEISYDITDAASNVESWTGTINPGNFYNYSFVSKTNHKVSNNNYITCVTINKVNSIIDDNTSNNSLCVTSNANSINIGNPFPNPTNGDVKLPITLVKDLDITIDLIDALGQTLYSSYTIKGTQGLNLITIPLSNFSQSMYTLKIAIADKVYTKKILKSVQ